MWVKVCLISSLFTQFGHNPGTGYKNKKKHLHPPFASLLPNIPQWTNNDCLAQTLVCYQIPMLIAQWSYHCWARAPPECDASLPIEQRKEKQNSSLYSLHGFILAAS